MGRYYRDPEQRRVGALIDKQVALAREAEAGGGWITYLIRDPRFPDKKGNALGTPIYVGQSKEFGTRVHTRFMKCEREATQKDTIERRVADLLHAGCVARYEVLERVPTRLASLVSETNWARLCVRRGYDIANRLALQKSDGPAIDRSDIPTDWIWPQFSVAEAIEDNLQIELGCRQCGSALRIGFEHFQRVPEPPRDIFQIKASGFWKVEPCTDCGTVGKRYATLRA